MTVEYIDHGTTRRVDVTDLWGELLQFSRRSAHTEQVDIEAFQDEESISLAVTTEDIKSLITELGRLIE